MEKSRRHSRLGAAATLKGTSDDNLPTALPVRLDAVTGHERLPAHEESQEMLRGKLRTQQADSTELSTLIEELSAHLVAIDSEDQVIFVTFKTFEEVWMFATHYTLGRLGHCMELLLFDKELWFLSLENHLGIKVSVPEDTLHVLYTCVLMEEASLFARCTASRMFDSCTSGPDLYLEQGDVALFEPPSRDSGWTVLCLSDGSRGTGAKPALEPVIPFHQWFLKSCPENILVGDGKPARDFPMLFAAGTCVSTAQYDAKGPDELSVSPNERIIIVGRLVSCHCWFLAMKEETGERGLLRTSLVKPSGDTYDSTDALLDGDEADLFSLREDASEDPTALLQRASQKVSGGSYKLDVFSYHDSTANRSHPSILVEPCFQENMVQLLDLSSSCVYWGTRVDKGQSIKAPPFTVQPAEERQGGENITLVLSFLDGRESKDEFRALYVLTPELVSSSIFCGHSSEDELISFLSVAREAARKQSLLWSQTRLCFLLGKFCAAKSKFSQARVYFEEALGVPRDTFADVRLLASIYSNLAAIYLLQRNTERFFDTSERLAALLMGTSSCLECATESWVLQYALKKAVVSENTMAEARACYLLAMHHWTREEAPKVVPYLERLLVLCAGCQGGSSVSPSRGDLTLARLHKEMGLRHLSISSARSALLRPAATLTDGLGSLLLVSRFCVDNSFPAHMATYLHGCLSLSDCQGGRFVWKHRLALCLSQLLYQHGMLGHAIRVMRKLIDGAPPSPDVAEEKSALLWLAWLHIHNVQPSVGLRVLDSVLAALPEYCATPLEGLVLNMRGVALRCMGDLRRAAESYHAAVAICQENKDVPNRAIALANLGLLCLKAGAKGVAQKHLTESVRLFSSLDGGHETTFFAVLLRLGQHWVNERRMDFGKGCYEWALLLAIKANLPDCQLTAVRRLCHFYEWESPDRARRVIYSQYQVRLLQGTPDREREGDALEAISQLFLSLATQRAYRAALDHTKSSLAIFIDLGLSEKEAYGWLQAGKIYHLLGQAELVELYVQVAQDVALSTGDTKFILKMQEAAGDIFFNSRHDQDKAIIYYRDGALPMADRSGAVSSRLRLCNKLAEVMFQLQLYGEALEFAHSALEISVKLGEVLNERVAYHRLASLYHRLGQCELAEHYYLKTLSLCPAPLQFDEEALYYARVYRTLGDILFYDLKDPFDAAGYYHLALAAAMDVGNKKWQLVLCTRLATLYHNFLMDRQLSLSFYKRSRGLAAELNVRRMNTAADRADVPVY
ncbi:SH3 domain and tetratricopeptide repeat-containing protein 1 isoform X1 [Syngnathus typhle]|uniref:SH3 domain and tetratricopeptide repeat-containing protein 1 isoform X1 n=2 Tax=Syngnathus typhle TaxID=161592 RepID=UPI002A6B1D8C|nr:SH3 domain and tetratricopeptide repeat-containing protein 1 isoform X1 [Syngnathus typhle]XP_061149616.1 SH3 domain and tetratricopeptide repeat-containing protein 1 isoform X1 [Syngnathus typhle]XP_061149625.1 SH3 domain and tetratricopeptide repeat-containing protein 1 isoform X1 [Syngnathus typhle]